MNLLIERIEIYSEPLENGQYLKSITFRFPILYGGQMIDSALWEKDTKIFLKKENSADYIEMNVEIPEALNIVPIHPATYPQINEYIMEKYGVKVHSNFIAEVKCKCGLDMRKNYNLVTEKA